MTLQLIRTISSVCISVHFVLIRSVRHKIKENTIARQHTIKKGTDTVITKNNCDYVQELVMVTAYIVTQHINEYTLYL